MPIRDQAAMERSLDNDYGTTRGSNAPASFEVALFMGDPLTGGVEVTATSDVDDGAGGVVAVANGYARATLSNDLWSPAGEGVKTTTAPVVFPDTLAEYPDTVTHWGLYDPVTAQWWDCAPITEDLDVTGAAPGPALFLSVFYADNLDPLGA